MVRCPQNIASSSRRGLDRQVIRLSIVFWVAFFIILMSRLYAGGQGVGLGYILAGLVVAASAIGLTYGIHIAFRRHVPEGPLARYVKVTGLGSLTVVLLTFMNVAAFALAEPGSVQKKWDAFLSLQEWFFVFTSFFWLLLAWTAIYTVLINAADLRERDRRLADAKRAAQQAQLAALRLQIHPHFLFNALNALSSLVILGRQADAKEMIFNLSSFLRRTLTTDPDQMTPLRDEIDVQMMYLGIERTRFPDRLKLECHIPESCQDALVPNLILQPLVENVIKHALGPSENPITLTIGAARQGDVLEVWIKDNGSSAGPVTSGLGIGLRNVDERLKARFGDTAGLEAGRDGACWISRIKLPWESGSSCAS
jgi:two-component system, LytTR family, sensor kinase